MTTQRPSPGNSIYAPLAMVGLWLLHAAITWYLSHDLAVTLAAFGLVAVGTLLVQLFMRSKNSRHMVWRPGLFAFNLAIAWFLWLIFNALWGIDPVHVAVWPLIGYISTHSSERSTMRKRTAKDLGV